MHLAVNLRSFAKGKIGGMENYVRRVAGGIAERQRATGEKLTIFASEAEVVNVARMAPGAGVIGVNEDNAERTIEAALKSGTYDLLFCPLLVLEPLRPGIPSAVTIPDLQHEFYPEFFDRATLEWRRERFGRSARHADVVFTLSEYSKSTIVERLGVDSRKVVVTELDADEEFGRPASPESKRTFEALGLPREYVYYPANFWPHKNHATLLRALRLLADAGHPDIHLVLTGAAETGLERVLLEAAALGLYDRVKVAGYQTPEVIAEIYRHSRGLPFVSRYEGFGIPILEAFRTGTPVVCSRSTSCPEVAGPAALPADETDAQDIAAALGRVLADETLRGELVRKGQERAAHYSWTRAVEKTWKELERVVADRPRDPAAIEGRDRAPLITVVTPSYNQGRFIRATINSVLSQDYPNVEYIIMDGGSTDETAAVVSEYASRVRWISEKDRGQSHAINKGFRMAKGELVSWLNSDDVILPNALRLAARAFQQNPALGAVYGEGYQIDIDGKIRQTFPCTEPFNLWKLMHLSDYILQQSSYFRKAVLDEVGYLDEDLHYALDWDLFIRIGKVYELGYIREHMGSIREYADAKSFAGGAKRFAELARMMRKHTGVRYPPGYWVYGLDTYIPIWCQQLEDRLPGGLARLAQSAIRFAGGNIIAQVSQKSQGLYADRWTGPKLKYMLRRGGGRVSMRGVLPELSPALRDQEIEVTCNGKTVGSFRMPPGEFRIVFEVPPQDGPASFVVRASRWVIPAMCGVERDYRRLSYRLESFGWG